MYGRSNNTILIIFLLVVVPVGMFILMNYTDHIEINIDKSYFGELNSCEVKNNNLQEELEKTQPICPDVTCDSSDNSWMLGIMVGVIATFLLMDNKEQLLGHFNKNKNKKKRTTNK